MSDFLGAGFDRAPWLVVAFGAEIACWFALPSQESWLALVFGSAAISVGVAGAMRADGAHAYVRIAGIVMPLAVAAGCASVWTRSELIGAEPIARPMVATFAGKVLSIEAQPARGRHRMVLATREPESGRAMRVRLNMPDDKAGMADVRIGAIVRVRARLVPPAPPMLPGAYNFARAAWFGGLAATGSALESPQVPRPEPGGQKLSDLQRRLTDHVREQLPVSEAGIAAA